MEENDFSALKDAMQTILVEMNPETQIIRYNYISFKEFCLSSCNNSVQIEQFNVIFDILTSKDYHQLRHGLIHKSQIESIGLTFERR
jgi:hypothetical protein